MILGIVISCLIFLAERYFGANLNEYAIGAISAVIGVPLAGRFSQKKGANIVFSKAGQKNHIARAK